MLASCSQEGEPAGEALPDGQYPLQIASVTLDVEGTAQPWTRVTETPDGSGSEWQEGDRIGVQAGTGTPGTYIVQADGTVIAETPVYWQSTAPATVTAWYPTDTDIDLSDQSQGLAYVLRARVQNAPFNQPVQLNFTHQLAKVRVVLNGTQAGQVTKVEVNNYPQCRNNRGSVEFDSRVPGWITMHKVNATTWEANVVPGPQIDPAAFIRLNGTSLATIGTGFPATLEAGKLYTIDLTVGEKLIDLSTYTGTSLTIGDKVILTGKNDNLQILLQGGADVTLQDVDLTNASGGPVIKTTVYGGNCTLTLRGTNKLTGTTVISPSSLSENDYGHGGGILVYKGTLTIDSEPGGALTIDRRIASGDSYGAGMNVRSGGSLVINGGDITILAVADNTRDSGAGIGSISASAETSIITINGGHITIGQGGAGSAAIGGGSNSDDTMDITITGEGTVITAERSPEASCIVGNIMSGTIRIGGGATVNGVKYDTEHIGEL